MNVKKVEGQVSLKKGKLILEDGSIFDGISFADNVSISGEVVFNTGMVGYPESFTDPSYKGQILVLTTPLVGNYGIPGNEKDEFEILKFFESEKIHISGLIVTEYCFEPNHWNCKRALSDWLIENKIPALYGIDTRALTKILREKGTMLGKIVIDEDSNEVKIYDPNLDNLVNLVSIKQKKVYANGKIKILLVDCGVKYNIIRCFLKRNVTVIRVPWDYDFSKEDYDGLFISNGPGDPKMCKSTIANLVNALKQDKPIFGICLGNQLLALAAGADTYKLKYGHRSQNQPCLIDGTKKCYITSQNHGFAVDTKTLKENWVPYFINANDGTNEGIRHLEKPFFSVQFHPEAACGPTDTEYLFDEFIKLIKKETKWQLIKH